MGEPEKGEMVRQVEVDSSREEITHQSVIKHTVYARGLQHGVTEERPATKQVKREINLRSI